VGWDSWNALHGNSRYNSYILYRFLLAGTAGMPCMGTLATTTIYYIDSCGLGQLERPAQELSLLLLYTI
jgi:hypothetical protein